MHRVAFASPGDDAPPGSRVRHVSRVTALVIGLSLVVALPNPVSALSWGPIRPITSDEQGFAWPGSTVAYSDGVAVVYREVVGGAFGAYVRRSHGRRHDVEHADEGLRIGDLVQAYGPMR